MIISKEFLSMLEKQLKRSLRKTSKKWLDLPIDYNISKFFEIGLYPTYNKYNNTYQCACPICREGKSLGKKRRCYYTPEKDLIHCHNCGWSSKPYNWIIQASEYTHEDIEDELLSGEYGYVDISVDEPVLEFQDHTLPEDSVNLFDPLQLDFWKNDEKIQFVVEYMKNRRLFTAKNKPDAYYFSFKDKVHKNRLIIPFKDVDGKIVFYQSRKIFEWDDKPKYISKINSNKSLFGIDKVDSKYDDVFIFEGPVDSTFVVNGVAVGGITEGGDVNFNSTQYRQWCNILLQDKIWVLDSQWIDQTSYTKTLSLIKNGEKVFIWPRNFGASYKDFNELCCSKKIDQISPKFVLNNSFSGMEAEVRMNLIKL